MDINEVGRLVTRIAITDNRTIDTTTILDWEEILPEWLPFDLAMQAIIVHRRTSTEYLQPAHVIAIAETLMEEQKPPPSLPPLLDDPAGCISLDAYIRRHPEDRAILKRIYRRKPGRFLDDTGAGDL